MEEEYYIPQQQPEAIITYDLPQKPQPKVALLSFTDYYILNERLSTLRGWELEKGTERVYPMLPQLAKVNIIETGYENLCVMPVSSEFQELYPELFTNLVNTYIPSPDSITEIITEGMSTEQIDWALKHFAATKSKVEMIWLGDNQRSSDSDAAVNELIAEEVTIITVE
jgi:hypothetical protein